MNQLKNKLVHLTITAAIVFGSLALLLALTGVDKKYSNLTLVLFLCGGCGAIVSNYRRLSLISESEEALQKVLNNQMVTIHLYISPLIGGILALLLWTTFFSGLIQGTFFPAIEGTKGEYQNFQDLLVNTHPASYADAAKGMFWAFVAGYSERFVTNIIDKLAEDSHDNKQSKKAKNNADNE
jgi:hypothetical protein